MKPAVPTKVQKAGALEALWVFGRAYLQAKMRLRPTRKDWVTAHKISRLFKAKPGSDHIASTFALAHLHAVLTQQRPTSVLEIGAGIGTITYLLASALSEDVKIVSTEHNEFCLKQLTQNLSPDMRKRVAFYDRTASVKGEFDLVILDGRLGPPPYRFLKCGTTCFAEGSRSSTRRKIEGDLHARGLICPMRWYPAGFMVNWQRSRRAKFATIKGCWIGEVGPVAQHQR